MTVMLIVLCCTGCCNESGVVAYVNGEAVETAEFMMIAASYKAEVVNYFYEKYTADYNSDFWQQDFDGENPHDVLAEKTMDKIVSTKLLQIEAKKNKVIKSCRYSDFMEQLENENSKRTSDKASGKRVYGVINYTAEEYYDDQTAKTKLTLLKKKEEELNPSDEELLKYYDETKDKSFKLMNESNLTFFRLENTAYDKMQELLQAVENGGDVQSKASELGAESEDMDVDNESFRYLSIQFPNVLELIEQNEYPIYSAVFEKDGKLCLVCVNEIKDGGYKEFEDVKTNVLSDYVENMLDEYLEEKREKVKIRYTDEYNQLDFKGI